MISTILCLLLTWCGAPDAQRHRIPTTALSERNQTGSRNGRVEALEKILLGRRGETDLNAERLKWILKVSIVPSSDDEPEIGLTLRLKEDGTTIASYIVPVGGSLRSQYKALLAGGKVSESRIVDYVNVQRGNFSEEEVPGLRLISRELESLKITVVPPDELAMDQPKYEFWSESTWGSRMEVTLVGYPGAEQTRPLVHDYIPHARWCVRIPAKLRRYP